MSKRVQLVGRLKLAALLCLLSISQPPLGLGAADLLPPGFRPLPLGVHALVGGKIVTKPGEVIDRGTVVIRDGLIQAVGKEVTPPSDAWIRDMKGTTIYAGFIDSYLVAASTNDEPVSTADSEPVTGATRAAGGVDFYGASAQRTGRERGPGYEVAKVTPEYRAARNYWPKEKTVEPLRELGFTAGLVVPGKGIIRGTSALVALSDEDPNVVILKPDVFQHIAFEAQSGEERSYPGSLMGVIACIRQSFFDTQHYALDQADYRKNPQSRLRPEFDPALEALAPAVEKRMRVAFEPGSALMTSRASQLAQELGLQFCLVSSGQEWRRPDLAKATGASFIVPVNFPSLPHLPAEEDWDQVSLDQLRAWDWASENPAVLRQQGLEIALTTYALSDKTRFRPNLIQAIDRGLSETDALAALTTVPARLCGIEDRLGTIEPGKLANLTVVAGESYFQTDAKVREVWIDGRIYRPAPEKSKGGKEEEKEAPPESAGKDEIVAKPKEGPEKKSKPPELTTQEKKKDKASSASPAEETKSARAGAKDVKREQLGELQKARVAHSPSEGRGPIPLSKVDPITLQPGPPDPKYGPTHLVVRGATLWLCDPAGTVVTNGILWVKEGKIAGAGAISIPALPDMLVIDGRDLHVTPGLIDCHSHTAILGAVNEGTLPSTAMVRIRDVINSETDNLYEQLAGGVTTANVLHGSANPIGGQNCVIKLRDGASPEELVFAAAPPGIKFALGENVKQSNWGERFATRFPQTRMGVRTFLVNRFTAAREYLAQCEKCKASGTVPPRRNLELEALGEILEGKRWIHCHSYRQDEILMLLRLMEEFGVKVGTFQHVLEGYKVAEEIGRHGAGASTFSDWWAYKFEVYDAIPYNGSLMRDRGVVVSFNSDSSELARRLYLEAAKAVKYGGTPEAEALKFVTLNPAKQLHIEQYVGSLEPGKDADFVLWSKSPLDSRTVCLQTWIDGRKYFDRSLAAQRIERRAKERSDLVGKAKKIAKVSAGDGEHDAGDQTGDSFFKAALEHQFDHVERNCLEEDSSD
jgi:imidazolonepropionase-like amidohydrolase